MRRVRFSFLYAAAWVPFALIYSLLLVIHSGLPVFAAIVSSVWIVVPAAILGIAAWYFGGRLRLRRGRLRFLCFHSLLATLYAACWTVWIILSLRIFAPGEVFQIYLSDALGWQLLSGAMLYSLVAGIAHAVKAGERLRAQKVEAERAEALRARAELQALRAQLNPHFLFNTLHSITALVRNDPSAVEEAMERLARLIRYTTDLDRSSPRDDVPLANELNFVRDYLSLEQLRFGERLCVVEQIDPETLDCTIPALTLQPLVENAVRHGIAPHAGGGTLQLHSHFEESQLVLEIKDDGAGADPGEALSATGLGLRGVRGRLLARYPERGDFEVTSTPGRGFRVRIGLPIEAEMIGFGVME